MSTEYTNPILPGFYPDPSVCRVGDDYYLVTSSFEYFPGVPIFHSRDLVNWRQIGHVLTRASQLNLHEAKSSSGIYAPTIRHHAGRFYMVTTDVSGLGNFYVHAESPAGPWSEPIRVAQAGIDPSLMFDDDGTVYFASNGLLSDARGLFLNEITDLSTGRLKHQRGVHLWEGTGGKYPEAPHLYRRGKWIYLLIAEGGTEFGHMVSVARATHPYGPYEACPSNPILSHRSLGNAIQSTGHAELFEDSHGRWWAVFLGVRHQGYPLVHHLGRETYLAPVDWTDDGWPRINGGRPVQLRMRVDGLDTKPSPRGVHLRDDFDTTELPLHLNFRRNPPDNGWSLTSRPGNLSLRCLATTLDETGPTAWVGRRQQHFVCTAETLVHFDALTSSEEAGLTVMMNENYHTDLFMTLRDDARTFVLRRRIGSLKVEVASLVVAEIGPVRLRISADEQWYEFSCSTDGATYQPLGKAETRHHATEIAGGFTGIYFAMYATAGGAVSENAAHFDWFIYDAPGDSTDRTHEPAATRPTDEEKM